MPSSGDEGYEVAEDFPFIGRTFEEYRRMFAIDPAELARGSVLDCAGGPSSFTAEAAAVGTRAAAVDPITHGRSSSSRPSAGRP